VIRIAVVLLSAIALFTLACTTTSETEPAPPPEPVVQAPPPPPPEPVAQPVAEPVRPAPIVLPKTASPLPLVGLTGVAALGLGGALRFARRRTGNRS
jgi:hypothetical protein